WVVLLAVLAAMWYAAISQRNNAAYLLMFFLGSLVMVSAVHAHFNLADLRLRVGRIEPVFEGENIRVNAEAINLSGRPRVALVLAPRGHVFKEAAHVRFGPLPARGSAHAEMFLPAGRRGRHPVGRLAFTTVYPMGFWRSWRYEVADVSCLIYPRPEGSLPLPEGPALTADVPAGVGAGGDDYAGVRPYQIGESQRHIDWRAVARGQPLMVKKFTGAGSRRVWFEYANTLALTDEEARLRQLSRWIVDADRDGLAYGLRLPGFEAEPARGTVHFHRCLAALALHGV
ncbi:MAG: DUF58 domain-containing protein, partial [Gluconacetobacter diazotrophicus]|nr:DUF58 domain-containing protein [Gluconacetobacter diazotrophicus]